MQELRQLQEEIVYTILIRSFNTPHPVLHGTSGQKISKDMGDLDNTINQFVLIEFYSSDYPTTAENTHSFQVYTKYFFP